jgi:hypothetical protein
MRKQQATASPDKAIENPERVNAIDMDKSPNSRPAKPSPQAGVKVQGYISFERRN